LVGSLGLVSAVCWPLDTSISFFLYLAWPLSSAAWAESATKAVAAN